MTTAQTTATTLNLRQSPGGIVTGYLSKGTEVSVLADSTAAWSHVTTAETPPRTGWVSTQYLTFPPAAPMVETLPPADDATHPVLLKGNQAFTPDGKPFARQSGAGFYSPGVTTLDAWLATHPVVDSVSASSIRVIAAVSQNEGRLEAVNSYDNAHLSFGLLQWTAGPDDETGEIYGLLSLLKSTSPAAFDDGFGQFGLDISGNHGYLALGGVSLETSAAKDVLRNKDWAYRFWRAGFSPNMRAAELQLATQRIGQFTGAVVNGFPLNAWLSSEYGIALVLDEHVNRPGHVPGTLVNAVTTIGATSPAGWTESDEHALIEAYLTCRAATTMTDSENRATAIGNRVAAGDLSSARGSFQA